MSTHVGPRPGNLILHLSLIALALGLTQVPAFAEGWARLTGLDAWLLVPGGLWLLFVGTCWLAIGLTHLLDTRKRPAWLFRTKIQPDRERAWQPSDREAVRLALVNHLLVTPPVFAAFYALLTWRGFRLEARLPGWSEVLLDLVLLTAITDVLFHVGHRALHAPWFMTRVHSVHHRFTAPTGLASQYQHPFEFAVTGIAPLAIAALVTMPHAFTMALFTVLGTLNIVVTHCGYNLPFATWAGLHDLHHARVRGNYSVTGLPDLLSGTMLPLDGPRN